MSATTVSSTWIAVPRPLSGARARLVCLPHAGAGASTYFPWAPALEPAGIEVRAVQYPGRERRLGEPAISDARAMIAALADAWPALCGEGPCAIYGHSMGAMLSYELARELARRGAANPPLCLFLSGRDPPHRARTLPSVGGLPDDELLAQVARHYGNLPAELLADRSLVAMFAPILRADFTLMNGYRWSEGEVLDLPLTVFGGTEDPWTTPAALGEWSRHTRAACRAHLMPGDHFFHQKARRAVLDIMTLDLADHLRSS